MTGALHIEAGRLRARILPRVGGGMARLDWRGPDGWMPVLRPYDGTADDPSAAMAMALNVLAPFSNRLSQGVTDGEGRAHALAPNLPGEAYPLHGDAWLAPWRVTAAGSDRAGLAHDGAFGPWRYAATLAYRLADGALSVDLAAENRGQALPFGLGLHPWFVRPPGMTLHAPAAAQWLEGPGHLPTERVDVADPRAFDAGRAAPLPEGWINAGFDGWTGSAMLRRSGGGVRLDVASADPPADRYVLHSPGAGAGFVCVEPVTHAIDAPRLPGGAAAHGMHVLPPGGRAHLSIRIAPQEETP